MQYERLVCHKLSNCIFSCHHIKIVQKHRVPDDPALCLERKLDVTCCVLLSTAIRRLRRHVLQLCAYFYRQINTAARSVYVVAVNWHLCRTANKTDTMTASLKILATDCGQIVRNVKHGRSGGEFSSGNSCRGGAPCVTHMRRSCPDMLAYKLSTFFIPPNSTLQSEWICS